VTELSGTFVCFPSASTTTSLQGTVGDAGELARATGGLPPASLDSRRPGKEVKKHVCGPPPTPAADKVYDVSKLG
jgi:hypothetical protein